MSRSKAAVFAAGLAVALAAPVLLGAAAGLPPPALVGLYALLGGLAVWLLIDERRRPLGLGLVIGGSLFLLGFLA